ncbi:MAG: hypothetical protein AAGF01_26500 [Cyanobacteria bacterium P01_G01_bin.38]
MAAKVDPDNSHKTALEFAQELLQHPETLSGWMTEVIDSDDKYSVDEMVAVSDMHLKDPEKFMKQLLTDLKTFDTQGL